MRNAKPQKNLPRRARRPEGPYVVLGGTRVQIAVRGLGIDGEKILTKVFRERNRDRD